MMLPQPQEPPRSSEPKRTRGRPPAREPSVTIASWVSQSQYDHLKSYANSHRIPISALLRRLLLIVLPPPSH